MVLSDGGDDKGTTQSKVAVVRPRQPLLARYVRQKHPAQPLLTPQYQRRKLRAHLLFRSTLIRGRPTISFHRTDGDLPAYRKFKQPIVGQGHRIRHRSRVHLSIFLYRGRFCFTFSTSWLHGFKMHGGQWFSPAP